MLWSQKKFIQTYKFAARAHEGQCVPGTKISYVMHLSFVSIEVIAAFRLEPETHDRDLAVQCALLHDVIEDTSTTYSDVVEQFGTAVADGILALSKDKSLPARLQLSDSLRRIREQPQEVWMVKLADRITNLQPAPDYWTQDKKQRYKEEATEIFETLRDSSGKLAARLLQKINSYAV